MSWYEMNQRRRANRGEAGSEQRRRYLEGKRLRKYGYAVILDKKRDPETEIVEHVVAAQAKDGCFGSLAKFDKDLYEEWALGTNG